MQLRPESSSVTRTLQTPVKKQIRVQIIQRVVAFREQTKAAGYAFERLTPLITKLIIFWAPQLF